MQRKRDGQIRIVTMDVANIPYELAYVLGIVGLQGRVKLVADDDDDVVVEDPGDFSRCLRSKLISVFWE